MASYGHSMRRVASRRFWTQEGVRDVAAAGDAVHVEVRTKRGESGVAASGQLVALEGASGTVRWRFVPEPGTTLGWPAIAGNLLVLRVATARGNDAPETSLVALDVETGEARWSGAAVGAGETPVLAGPRVFTSVPAQGPRRASARSDVVALAAASGAELWRVTLAGDAAGLSSDGETVYVGIIETPDAAAAVEVGAEPPSSPEPLVRDLVALDVGTGDERWRAPFRDFLEGTIAAADGSVAARVKVFHQDEDGVHYDLLVHNAATGERRWTLHGIGSDPVLAGGLVYVLVYDDPFDSALDAGRGKTRPGSLVALDLTSGAEQWRLTNVGVQPIVAGETIYTFGRDGLVAIASGGAASDAIVATAPPATPSAMRDPGFGPGDAFTIAVSRVWCPQGQGSDDQPLEMISGGVDAAAAQGAIADGQMRIPEACERDSSVNRITLVATSESGAPQEIASAWTGDAGDATLQGAIPADATAVAVELAMTPLFSFFAGGGFSEPSPLALSFPLAREYTLVSSETRYATLTLRDYTCPAGTPDPVVTCSDTPVAPELDCSARDPQEAAEPVLSEPAAALETPAPVPVESAAIPDALVQDLAECARSRSWNEFEVQWSGSGGRGPDGTDYQVHAGPVRIVERPFSRARYTGAYVACVDELLGDTLFTGSPDETGAVIIPVPAGNTQIQDGFGAVRCDWYHLTPPTGAK